MTLTEKVKDMILGLMGGEPDRQAEMVDGLEGKYIPSNPANWAGTPPKTYGEAIDRIAELLGNNGGVPIP